METSVKLTQHFLKCTVCTEVFKDPCTLECNHTFCRNCVIRFTKTQPDAVRRKSIPCPFCWKWTKVLDPSKPVEQWTGDIKPLFLVQGLLDSFVPDSKDTTHCCYCKVRGETTPATVWCSVCNSGLCDKCVLIHQEIPATRNHLVADLTSEVKVKRRRKVACKEHIYESIEFHCKDCKKAICQKCCIIYHRKCESVVTLESEVEEMKAVLVKSREKFVEREHQTRKRIEERKTETGNFIRKQSELKSEIRSTCDTVIGIIKEKESNLLKDVDEAAEKRTEQLKADIKTGEMAMQMYQQQAELIDHVVKSDCEMEIYEMYQLCEFEDVEETNTNQLQKDKKEVLIKWRKNTEELIESVSDLQFGHIDVIHEAKLDPDATLVLQETIDVIKWRNNTEELFQAVDEPQFGDIDVIDEVKPDLKTTPVLQHTINVRVQSDRNQAYPSDVSVLNVNGIETVVVTDWTNSSVKSFYSRNNQSCHSKLELDHNPWCLTQVNHSQVAVTVPSGKQIIIANVNPDLTVISKIKTQKSYRGIDTWKQSTLAVSSASVSPCVDILDMSGNIIRTIPLPTDANQSSNSPYFLCTTTKGHILTSNYGQKSVLCLTPEGNVVFNYKGDCLVNGSTGITYVGSGDILVADRTENTVLRLTESGQFVRQILTPSCGLTNPWGIFMDKSCRLYVCLYAQGVIKVFKCTT